MSKLPILVCPREDFVFQDGQKLSIRGLSRAEAIKARVLGQNDDENMGATATEVYIIQCAAEVNEQEAAHFHSVSPSGEIERLINKVAELSGLKPETGKADAEHSHSATSTESTTS